MSLSVMTIASPRMVRRLAAVACGAVALLAGSVAQAALPIENWTASTGAKVFFVLPRADHQEASSRVECLQDPCDKIFLSFLRLMTKDFKNFLIFQKVKVSQN